MIINNKVDYQQKSIDKCAISTYNCIKSTRKEQQPMTDTVKTEADTKQKSIDRAMHIVRTMPESKLALAIAYMSGMEMSRILDEREKGA